MRISAISYWQSTKLCRKKWRSLFYGSTKDVNIKFIFLGNYSLDKFCVWQWIFLCTLLRRLGKFYGGDLLCKQTRQTVGAFSLWFIEHTGRSQSGLQGVIFSLVVSLLVRCASDLHARCLNKHSHTIYERQRHAAWSRMHQRGGMHFALTRPHSLQKRAAGLLMKRVLFAAKKLQGWWTLLYPWRVFIHLRNWKKARFTYKRNEHLGDCVCTLLEKNTFKMRIFCNVFLLLMFAMFLWKMCNYYHPYAFQALIC
jgi:hypothetical protein